MIVKLIKCFSTSFLVFIESGKSKKKAETFCESFFMNNADEQEFLVFDQQL